MIYILKNDDLPYDCLATRGYSWFTYQSWWIFPLNMVNLSSSSCKRLPGRVLDDGFAKSPQPTHLGTPIRAPWFLSWAARGLAHGVMWKHGCPGVQFQYTHYNTHLVGGWPTPLKNMKVSWDDDIPNIWGKMFQTTNQTCMFDKLWIHRLLHQQKQAQNWKCPVFNLKYHLKIAVHFISLPSLISDSDWLQECKTSDASGDVRYQAYCDCLRNHISTMLITNTPNTQPSRPALMGSLKTVLLASAGTCLNFACIVHPNIKFTNKKHVFDRDLDAPLLFTTLRDHPCSSQHVSRLKKKTTED